MGPDDKTINEVIRLPNPPTKKWVKFQDWDEEALEYRRPSVDELAGSSGDESSSSHYRTTTTDGRPLRHSTAGLLSSSSQLSSSVSSDSSFGSCGDGGGKCFFGGGGDGKKKSAMNFSASFGGTDREGGAAALRSIWPNCGNGNGNLDDERQRRRGSGPSYLIDELENIDLSATGPPLPTSKYAAFDELRNSRGPEGAQLGWSHDVLGREDVRDKRPPAKVSKYVF